MVADFMGLENLMPGTVRAIAGSCGRIELAAELALDIAKIDGLAAGDRVDIAIRPENIRLRPPTGTTGPVGGITNHVFLGNLSEYYVTLPSGAVLRVQTHPSERFSVGDQVAVEIDAAQCSVFRHSDE
jgi:ABC-type Fe3+/spermidine/putrescine transport system ATPase subunit